jgi:hypothetical protein
MKWICLMVSLFGLSTFSVQAANTVNHVHLMHLDGIRSDLIQSMLKDGTLPNLGQAAKKGKIDYETSTVNKSETMKVILSYLSSKVDTEVVGWWQFSREKFGFRNFWIDPVEVFNYALGLDFPRYPTIFDYLSNENENIVAGFHLHRRSVPFDNYARAYMEGFTAVSDETYLNQARASVDDTLDILTENAEKARLGKVKMPVLSTSLLACVDEFVHVDGVVTLDPEVNKTGEFCVERQVNEKRLHDPMEALFVDIDSKSSRGIFGMTLPPDYKHYYTKIEWSGFISLEPVKLCVKLPMLTGFFRAGTETNTSVGTEETARATPRQVLAMIFIDIQIKRIMETFETLGLLDKTMFLIFGDHGMTDTKRLMVPFNSKYYDKNVNAGSLGATLIGSLNASLNLANSDPAIQSGENELIGIDDAALPNQLIMPHKDSTWQSPEIKTTVNAANDFANSFFDKVKTMIKSGALDKVSSDYWYVSWMLQAILRSQVDSRVDSAIEPMRTKAVDTIAKLYLAGDTNYVKAEKAFLANFYDQHVRLVYGGGARNNAEIFIPAGTSGSFTWSRRPSLEEMMNFRPENAQTTLMKTLMNNPGVGLFFIRRNNEAIVPESELDGLMEIEVFDRFSNKGLITVKRQATGELRYWYQVLTNTDPLAYMTAGAVAPQGGTWNNWNEWSINEKHYYHNVVAGMGSFLYSSNPSIGDIVLMRSQGWNFGENNGGHGGVHREEMLTFMLATGAGITPGKLLATDADEVQRHATLLDIAPTVLKALGHPDSALTDFAQNGFEQHLNRWVKSQKQDVLNHFNGLKDLQQAMNEANVGTIDFDELTAQVSRLLNFMPTEAPVLPDFNFSAQEGGHLILN